MRISLGELGNEALENCEEERLAGVRAKRGCVAEEELPHQYLLTSSLDGVVTAPLQALGVVAGVRGRGYGAGGRGVGGRGLGVGMGLWVGVGA